jgi:hypothetical protein
MLALRDDGIIEDVTPATPTQPVANVITFHSTDLEPNVDNDPTRSVGGAYEYTAFLRVLGVDRAPDDFVAVLFGFVIDGQGGYTLDGNGRISFGDVATTGAGGIAPARSLISSTVDPTVTDDSSDGYSIGSVWINTTADLAYTLVDATVGAAVWQTSVGGADLSWDAATSTVASASGTDATLTAVDATNPGLMLSADKTKLDAIEAGADVTDATNVAAAGALMDSEVDANIKTLVLPASTTITAAAATVLDDVSTAAMLTTLGAATAAQGSLADSALQTVAVTDIDNGTDGELITWSATGAATTVPAGTSAQVLTSNGAGTVPTFQTQAGGGDALTSNPLSQFASTTSAQLAGVLSDETGTGLAVFGTSPTLITPALGTIASGDLSAATGTAAALTVGATTGVEAGADVTDATNVAAAGALMDSEVDANIKTLSLPASTTITAAAATVLDDVSTAAMLTTLGAQAQSAVLDATTASFTTAAASEITANTAKTGISSGQASEITANTAKVSYSDAALVATHTTDIATNTGNISTNATTVFNLGSDVSSNWARLNGHDTDISSIQSHQGTQDTAIVVNSTAIALNTAKTGISSAQASEITANTAKVSYSDAALVATHTGEISTLESGQATQDSAIALNTAKTGISSAQASEITANTAKTGISSGQASEITANTAKTGISSGQASEITANTAKTGISSGQASEITANTAKTGISSGQASEITANTAKVSYGDAAVVAGHTTDIATNVSAIALNTAKTGISSAQASEITANTAKTGISSGQASEITANTAKVSYSDAALVATHTTDIATNVSAIALNTAKTGISSAQASEITANTAKTGISSGQASEITANTAKVSYSDAALVATHTTDIGTNTTKLAGIEAGADVTDSGNVASSGAFMASGVSAFGATLVDDADAAAALVTLGALDKTLIPTEIMTAASDEVTAIVAGAGLMQFRMPYAMTGSEIRASLGSACATGTFTLDVLVGAATVFSTLLTVDATEKTSVSAAIPAVLSVTAWPDDSAVSISVTNQGDGTATGLKVTMIGTRSA